MQKLGLGTPVNKDLAQDPDKGTDSDQTSTSDVFLALLSSMQHETDATQESTQVDPAMNHHQENFADLSKAVAPPKHAVARGSKQALPETLVSTKVQDTTLDSPTPQTGLSPAQIAQGTGSTKTPGPALDHVVTPAKQPNPLSPHQQMGHAPGAAQPKNLTTSPQAAAKASTFQSTAAPESTPPSPITSIAASSSTVKRTLADPDLASGSPSSNPGITSKTDLPLSTLTPPLSAERSTLSISSQTQSPRRPVDLSKGGRSSYEGAENKTSIPNISPSPLVSIEGAQGQPPSSLEVHPRMAEVAANAAKTTSVTTTAQDAIAPKSTKQHWSAGKKTGPNAQKARLHARQAPASGNNMPGFSGKDHVLAPDVHNSSCEDKIEAKHPPPLESGGISPTTIFPQQSPDPQVSVSSGLRPMIGAASATSTPAPVPSSQANLPTEHLVQTLRQAMDVKVTPHDLRWKDPQFGELSLRIERHGDELEISIRSAIAQTHETLKQHHLAIADELTLDPQQLRFEAPNSSDQQRSQEQSHSAPFSEQRPKSNAQQRETSTKSSKATNPTQPSARPLSPSSQGLDLFA